MKQVKSLLALLMSFSLLASCSDVTESNSDTSADTSSSEEEGDYTITNNFALCGKNLTSSTTFSLLAHKITSTSVSAPSITTYYVEEGAYYIYQNWLNDFYQYQGFIDLEGEEGDAPLAFEEASYTVYTGHTIALNLTVYGDDGSAIVWSASDNVTTDEINKTDETLAYLHDGLLTAYESAGSVTVTATLGNHSKSTTITIVEAGEDDTVPEDATTATVSEAEDGCYEFAREAKDSVITLGDKLSDGSGYDEYRTPVELSSDLGTEIKNAFVHNGIGSSSYGDFYLNSPDYPNSNYTSDQLKGYLVELEKILGIYEVVNAYDKLTIDYCKLNVGSRTTYLTFSFYGTYDGGYNGFLITTMIYAQGENGSGGPTSCSYIEDFIGQVEE